MNKRINKLLIIGLVGLLAFLIYDWQRKRTDFDREDLANGWYRYSNDDFVFHYPGKLRNCYECPFNNGIYSFLTDGNYVIMYSSEEAESSKVYPQSVFTYPINSKVKELREVMDSILLSNEISPTDRAIRDNLIIQEIDYSFEDAVMTFQMEVMGVPIISTFETDDLTVCSSWNNWSLDNRSDGVKKFGFGSFGGGLFLQKDEKVIFFTVVKINRTFFLYKDNSYKLSRRELFRIFRNVEYK